MKFQRSPRFCIAAAAALVACGGGSGNSPASAPTVPSTASVPSQSTGASAAISSSVLPSSYSGEELAAFDALNAARTGCGFGALNQNTLLDTAAFNLLQYLVQNKQFGHVETAGLPGFSGVTSGERVSATGFANWLSVSEDLSAQLGTTDKNGFGQRGIRNLLGAPYHLMSMMQGNREVGLSVKSGSSSSGADIVQSGAASRVLIAADMAYSQTLLQQLQGAGEVLSYPCQGVANTAYQLTNESPNPISGRDLAAQPVGQPILVQVREGQTLTIQSASMASTVGAVPVAIAVTLTQANDPNAVLAANQALVIPNAPLAINTAYTVTISGSNNAAPFVLSFTFTTGASSA